MREVELDAYLARIGLAERPAADRAGLERLQRAHRRAIPFENFDIALGRGISLDPDALFDKLVTRRRGGYCFEQNGLFLSALTALGFAARPLLARVWLFADAVPPRTHALALVELNGEAWTADAGFGGSDVPPLRLADGSEAVVGGVRHRLDRDPAFGWMLTRDGQRQYSFTEDEVWPADLALANHWTATAPDSRFTRLRIASIVTEDGLDTFDEAELNTAAFRNALATRFDITLSEDEVAALRMIADPTSRSG